ncbi:MAG TPA: VOC family protein [Trebonia sp.]|jgi:catechol 2,3-dioxygenase-like lactoylglutathione lyase family enzyme|nr:VOC family protein [Trebonia sp.]
MTSAQWPEGLPAGGFRFVRRSNHFAEAVAFYRDLAGLPLLLTFNEPGADGAAGYDGAVFGLPDKSAVLEIVSSATEVPVDPAEQFVLYLPGAQARDVAVERVTGSGAKPVTPSQYWIDNDSVAFADPDGRQVIFAPWIFGQEPMPARLKGLR